MENYKIILTPNGGLELFEYTQKPKLEDGLIERLEFIKNNKTVDNIKQFFSTVQNKILMLKQEIYDSVNLKLNFIFIEMLENIDNEDIYNEKFSLLENMLQIDNSMLKLSANEKILNDEQIFCISTEQLEKLIKSVKIILDVEQLNNELKVIFDKMNDFLLSKLTTSLTLKVSQRQVEIFREVSCKIFDIASKEENNFDLMKKIKVFIYCLEDCFKDVIFEDKINLVKYSLYIKIDSKTVNEDIAFNFDIFILNIKINETLYINTKSYEYILETFFHKFLKNSTHKKTLICNKYGFKVYSDQNFWISLNLFVMFYIVLLFFGSKIGIITYKIENTILLLTKESMINNSKLIKTKNLKQNVLLYVELGMADIWF